MISRVELSQAILFIKEEFFGRGEAHYHTDSWIRAEQEAGEDYRQGNLEAYNSVDEMVHDILP